MKKLILFFVLFLSLFSVSFAEENFQKVGELNQKPLFSFNNENKDNIYYLFQSNIKKQNGELVFEFPPFISSSLSVFQTKNGYIFSYYMSYYGKYNKFTLLYYDFATDSFSIQTLPFTNPLKNNVLNAYMRDGYMYLYRYTPKTCSLSSGCYGPFNQYYKISLDSSVDFETITSSEFLSSNSARIEYGNFYNLGNSYIQYVQKSTKTFYTHIYNDSENTIFQTETFLNFENWINFISENLQFWIDGSIDTTKIITTDDNQLIISFSKGEKVFSCHYYSLNPEEGQPNCDIQNDKFIFDIENGDGSTAYSVPSSTTEGYSYYTSAIAPIVNVKYVDGELYYYYVDESGDIYSSIPSPTQILYNGIKEEAEQTNKKICKNLFLNYPYNVPVTDLENNIIADVSYADNSVSYTFQKNNSERKYFFSVGNVDNSLNFTKEKLNNQDITFNPLNTPYRFFGSIGNNYTEWPYLQFSGNFEGKGFFKIEGNGPEKRLGNPMNCETNEVDFDKYYYFGEEYTFEGNNICIIMPAAVGDTTFSSVSFGSVENQIVEREVCVSPDGTTTVDGEDFDGDIENPSNRQSVSQFQESAKNSNQLSIWAKIGSFIDFILSLFSPPDIDGDFTENQFYKFSMSILEKIPGLGDMLSVIYVSLPKTPNLNLHLPFIDISTPGKIGYQTVSSDLPVISDRLSVSILEKNESGSKFISFVLAVLYISIRIGLFFAMFYLIKMFWDFTEKIISLFFGKMLAKDRKGNLFTAIVFAGVIILIMGALFSIFTYIAPILPIFSTFADYITVVFSYFTLSFFDYSFFAGIVNLFFGTIGTVILIYIAYLIAITFVRAN